MNHSMKGQKQFLTSNTMYGSRAQVTYNTKSFLRLDFRMTSFKATKTKRTLSTKAVFSFK